MKTLYEYFDPHNWHHIAAYRELQKTGVWPKWFWDQMIKDNINESEPGWQVTIIAKMANAWVEHVAKTGCAKIVDDIGNIVGNFE